MQFYLLQIKTQGTQVNAATKFKNNQWYHLAFVCDGVKLTIYVNGNIDATLDLPRKPLRLVKNSFGICNGDWMVTDAIVSEVRFWTTAISQSQIQNNMFAINPGTDGLEAYWKLNEGAGTESHIELHPSDGACHHQGLYLTRIRFHHQ